MARANSNNTTTRRTLLNGMAPVVAALDEMAATPAHTPEGRRAKVIVLLRCVMGDEWCRVDEHTEHREKRARELLIELIGGEPGEQLRDQFA